MSKRMQNSIEFIILLACVSTLSLSVILLYKNLATQGADTVSIIANKSMTVQAKPYVQVSTQAPYLSFYIPANSSVGVANKMQIDAYGCDNGNAQINISSNTISFSRTELTLNLTGIAVANLSFEPLQAGPAIGLIHYTVNCASDNQSGSYSIWTYGTYKQQQSSGFSDDYAIISNRNESIVYGLENLGNVENFTTFNHCTYVNFWTVPYGISQQCNYDTGASDYRIFDGGCLAPGYPYTRTYCMVPEQLGYNISQLDGSSYSLNYSFKLTLQTALGTATTNLSSESQNSIVYSNGVEIGTATVSDPYTSSYLSQKILVQGQNQGYSYGNSTIYVQYQQANNNLNNLLQYYNNSELTGDIQSNIQAYLYAVSSSSSALVSSLAPVTGTNCKVIGKFYKCISEAPFTYQITVNLPELVGQNESLYYAGTLIRIS